MIKPWKERCLTRISEGPSDNFQREMQAEIDELRAKLDESEICLQSSIDCNLNKLLAMSDEQVTALTRLEGSNPADVAALTRKTMDLAATNVKLNECSRLYEAALKREFDLAQKLGALEKQEPVAWMYDWECEGELVKNWMTTDNAEAHSLPNGCHNIRPLFLAAGAAPVPNSEIIEALEEIMRWQVKNVKRWHNPAYDNADRVLKKLQAAPAPKEKQ